MSSEPIGTACVARHFNHTPECVFDAWIDPERLGRWMFGPEVREEEILHLKLDPVLGGSFSFLVRRGEAELDHIGEYLALDRPRQLAFTWGIRQEGTTDFSVVRMDITPEGDGCDVRITHEMHPAWAAYADRAATGWTHMLNALARLLE